MSENIPQTKAIIADDETPSRAHLKSQILSVWPELVICGEAANGVEAKHMIETIRPDIAFLDIKMPGLSGMQVARDTAGICRVVFITAYDQYALDAFENAAVDYIMKPATAERLEKTVQRLKMQIADTLPPIDMSVIVKRLMSEMGKGDSPTYLKWIKAKLRDSIRLIPVEKICFFRASDKYTTVITKKSEVLIKKSIIELAEELDPNIFFRIHRGTIVNANYIDKISTSPTGRGQIRLIDRPEILTVSRSYLHLFKRM
jgi:DNA-binding LytR/AlgR family response regulator